MNSLNKRLKSKGFFQGELFTDFLSEVKIAKSRSLNALKCRAHGRRHGQNLNFYLDTRFTQPRITFISFGYEIWPETEYIIPTGVWPWMAIKAPSRVRISTQIKAFISKLTQPLKKFTSYISKI